jgi:hypothetical protein
MSAATALDLGIGVAEREAAVERRGDRDRAHLRLARELRRHGALLDLDDGRERHHRARRRSARRSFSRSPGSFTGAVVVEHLHVVALVVDEDLADGAAVEHRLDRLAEAVDDDAEVGGALAVDGDEELGLGGVVVEPHLAEARVLLQAFDQGFGHLGERA